MNADEHARVWRRVARQLQLSAEDAKDGAGAKLNVIPLLQLAVFAQAVAGAYQDECLR